MNVKQLKDAGIIDPDGDTRDVVVYDAGTSKGQVSFGGANGTLLDKVAAGAVGSSSMQAINGSQLFGTAQSVADALGGKSAVDANGSVTKPTYTLGAGTYDNVGDALAAAYSSGGDALGWNDTAGAYDAKRGTSATNKIIDVANGAGDNDAVNVAQLKAVINGMGGGSTIDSTTGDVTGPTYNITNKDGDVVTVNNAGDAFNAIDGRITNVTNEINNGTIGLVQQAAAGEKLTVGKDNNTDGTTNYNSITLNGGDAGTVIHNVANGSAATDAVNTDRLGSDAYNLKLSMRRAMAVKNYLVSQGVPAEAISAEGLGNTAPKVDCHQRNRQELIACLRPNRRVVIQVIAR